MGSPKNLNVPQVYAEALAIAGLDNDIEKVAQWLADDDQVTKNPYWKLYSYYASRLIDMAPQPSNGFRARPKHAIPAPKLGRNDICPCGSGKKYKVCHLGRDEVSIWKLGAPTPEIRAMAIAQLIHRLPIASLGTIPLTDAAPLVLVEMASAYYNANQAEPAITLLKQALDVERDDPFLLYDYWVARYAEWLVEADRTKEAEEYLLDEFDAKRGVQPWQVAQKLTAFYIDQGDPDNAEIWIETALEGDPDNPFNHYLNGLLHHTVSQWEAAVTSYERAKELSDNFREQEKIYMVQLVDEALERALKQQPIDDEEELPEAVEDATLDGDDANIDQDSESTEQTGTSEQP